MLDNKDKLILNILQRDVTTAINDIAERVGLSTTPCWRRIQKLEQAGFIQQKVALLDPEKLNIGVTAGFLASQHNPQWLESLNQLIHSIPEILETHRMSGNTDYLLKVVVPSIKDYDRIYKKLIEGLAFTDISSSFSMEVLKSTTSLPTEYIS